MAEYDYIELAIFVPPFLKSGNTQKTHLKTHENLEAFKVCDKCQSLDPIDQRHYGVTANELNTLYKMVQQKTSMKGVFLIFGAYNMEHILTSNVAEFAIEANSNSDKSFVLGDYTAKTDYNQSPTAHELYIYHKNPAPQTQDNALPTFAKAATMGMNHEEMARALWANKISIFENSRLRREKEAREKEEKEKLDSMQNVVNEVNTQFEDDNIDQTQ